jgi:hypothetical protein
MVTTFVYGSLAPRVRVIEGALATADQLVLAYHATAVEPRALSFVLQQQADRVWATEDQLNSVAQPALSVGMRLQMNSLLEDLILDSQQLRALFQETADAVSQLAINGPVGLDGAVSVGYGPRARSAMALLRRAQDWLHAIDNESGARACLPGFEVGAPPLQQQLNVPWPGWAESRGISAAC